LNTRKNHLHELTITEASRLIRGRQLSPVELTEALITRSTGLDDQLNAFITPTFDLALSQARRAEAEVMAGRYLGPLHGIPYGLKDLFYTKGVLTTGNSRVGANFTPDFDATVVSRLANAGAVLMGKQTAHELAHGGPSHDLPWPPARNPWNTDHFTGGSSSGPAAAVAAGFMPATLGTDTGGSIRSPASFCGLVGLKPTYGLVSRYGVIPHSFSLDHCGPITRTVEDCASLLQVIAGHDPRDPASAKVAIPDYGSAIGRSIRGLRIGVLRHLWEEDIPADEELRRATENAVAVMEALGAVTEVARISNPQFHTDVKAVICESEAFAVQRSNLKARLLDFGVDYLSQVLLALSFQASDYVRAQRHRLVLAKEMAPLYQKYDVLLTAGLGPAPRLDDQYAKGTLGRRSHPSITTIFNVTGAPALMMCSGFSKNGLPIGIQLAGRPFDESTLFALAHAYEKATSWHERRPELVPGAKVNPLKKERPGPDLGAIPLDGPDCAAIRGLAKAAGLTLPDEWVRQVAANMPMAAGMLQRIPDHAYTEEPAGIFSPLL